LEFYPEPERNPAGQTIEKNRLHAAGPCPEPFMQKLRARAEAPKIGSFIRESCEEGAMEDRRVKQAAEKLRKTVDGQKALDEAARQRLASLASAAVLEAKREDREGLIQRLLQEITRFEATHPELTASLLEMVEALSAAGI
jgi:hypothetical protein